MGRTPILLVPSQQELTSEIPQGRCQQRLLADFAGSSTVAAAASDCRIGRGSLKFGAGGARRQSDATDGFWDDSHAAKQRDHGTEVVTTDDDRSSSERPKHALNRSPSPWITRFEPTCHVTTTVGSSFTRPELRQPTYSFTTVLRRRTSPLEPCPSAVSTVISVDACPTAAGTQASAILVAAASHFLPRSDGSRLADGPNQQHGAQQWGPESATKSPIGVTREPKSKLRLQQS